MSWTAHFRKAFTLSYDDGNEADAHLIELLRDYGVKCTFNLNSGLNAENGSWQYKGVWVNRLDLETCTNLYRGHEIAVHGKHHLAPTSLDDAALHEEYADDLETLTHIFGKAPVGMAYAYGDYNDRVVEKLRSLGLRYGRTVWENHDFSLQSDLLRFRPTCHHDDEALFDLIARFLTLPDDAPAVFCLWGHTYEFDGNHNWDRLEHVLDRLAGRDDVFYGTNAQVLLGLDD